mgnify:CR=1 FL=1
MYQIMTADEAMDLINDGDVIALNSFLGIDIPIELHEALYKRYQRTGSPKHLTAISSAGFGAWDENKAAEGYIRDGAVDKISVPCTAPRSLSLRTDLRHTISHSAVSHTQFVHRPADFREHSPRSG